MSPLGQGDSPSRTSWAMATAAGADESTDNDVRLGILIVKAEATPNMADWLALIVATFLPSPTGEPEVVAIAESGASAEPIQYVTTESEAHGGVRFEEDIGCSKSFERSVLSSIRERGEQERVEREPDAQPHQYPPTRVKDQVGVPAGAHNARLHDHEHESQYDDGESYPQRENAVEPDCSTFSLVVRDSMVAVTVEGTANPLVHSAGNPFGG
jgi:hypothetical protein